ncbi:MAG TPA: ribosome-associated translation inhibitor RaiA [Planctomycetota bacterium]|nr:ribosome-associated translation inhibitor RaiA [Planctomycetota bacterium]
MDLQIEGRHFKVTEAIQNHLEEKLGKLEKYFDGIHRMHVILAVEKTKRQMVELVCTVAKRHTLFAKGEADDMYVAIDKAEKKMLTEMKKYKAKLRPVVRGKKTGAALSELAMVEASDEDTE